MGGVGARVRAGGLGRARAEETAGAPPRVTSSVQGAQVGGESEAGGRGALAGTRAGYLSEWTGGRHRCGRESATHSSPLCPSGGHPVCCHPGVCTGRPCLLPALWCEVTGTGRGSIPLDEGYFGQRYQVTPPAPPWDASPPAQGGEGPRPREQELPQRPLCWKPPSSPSAGASPCSVLGAVSFQEMPLTVAMCCAVPVRPPRRPTDPQDLPTRFLAA